MRIKPDRPYIAEPVKQNCRKHRSVPASQESHDDARKEGEHRRRTLEYVRKPEKKGGEEDALPLGILLGKQRLKPAPEKCFLSHRRRQAGEDARKDSFHMPGREIAGKKEQRNESQRNKSAPCNKKKFPGRGRRKPPQESVLFRRFSPQSAPRIRKVKKKSEHDECRHLKAIIAHRFFIRTHLSILRDCFLRCIVRPSPPFHRKNASAAHLMQFRKP